jgi:hypothetical protein
MELSKKNQKEKRVEYSFDFDRQDLIYAALYEFDIENKHHEYLYIGQTTKSLRERWGSSGFNHVGNAKSIIKATGSTNKLEDLLLAWKGSSVVSLFIIDHCGKGKKKDLNSLEKHYKTNHFKSGKKVINLITDPYGLNKI